MKKLICATILTTAVALVAGTTASGAQVPEDDPQLDAGVAAPVLVCPIGISLGGDIATDCPPQGPTIVETNTPAVPGLPGAPTDDPNQIGVDAPVNVCPVGVSLGGDVEGGCPPPLDFAAIIDLLFPFIP